MRRSFLASVVFYILFLVLLFPFICVILFSFADFKTGELHFVSMIGYNDLFEDLFRIKPLYLILIRSFINASLAVTIALPFSYILFRDMKNTPKPIILISLTLPFLINDATRIFSWNFILGGQGIVNTIIHYIDSKTMPISWLSNSEFSVRLVMLATSIPFAVFLLVLSFSSIKKSLWNASQDLGANKFFEFFKVAIPLSKGSIIASWVLLFLLSFSMSTEVSILGGITKYSIRLMITDLLSASKITDVMVLGSIFIIFITFLIFVFFLIQKRISKKYKSFDFM